MQELLETGLKELGIDPTRTLCSSYLNYIDLLIKWNKTYNLTAIREPRDILQRHILDSLSVHKLINGTNCLDVGTGAGLPGLILALSQNDKKWTLLDSNQKKLRFVQHVKASLKINNIEIINSRVEEIKPDALFDTVICRAFSSLIDYYNSSKHLINSDGILLAMKGKLDEGELAAVRPLVKTLHKEGIEVPGLDGQRSIVKMTV